ncbi:MAG: FAD-binding oxidoreductase, partial [Pseudomonadota bacterium]
RTGDARANWQGRFDWEVLDRPGFAGWPPPHEAPFGVVWDTLTARVDPRRLTEVLGHIISQRSDIVLATPVVEIDPHTPSVLTLAGTRYTAGYVVIAAGAQTFPLLRPFAPGLSGYGVAGQAVLMVLSSREYLPVLYDDGIYVVPHEGGRVAVGSTVDRSAEGPVAYDPNRNDFLGRALALCPALQGAPILEGWAGLRPNCAKRRPLVGRLPDTPTIFVATGGYGISFGIGERVGAAIAEEIAGTDTLEVPESFRPASHLSSDQRLPDDVG